MRDHRSRGSSKDIQVPALVADAGERASPGSYRGPIATSPPWPTACVRCRRGLRRGPRGGTQGPHTLNPLLSIRRRTSAAVRATGTDSLAGCKRTLPQGLAPSAARRVGRRFVTPTDAVPVVAIEEPGRERPRVVRAKCSRDLFVGGWRPGFPVPSSSCTCRRPWWSDSRPTRGALSSLNAGR